MRVSLIVMGVLLAASASATTYKWVDKDGITHYSDRPAPGAEVVDLQPVQTFTPSAPRPSSGPGQPRASDTDQGFHYTKLDLWKPENEETFQNAGNSITARLRLEPELQPGHSIWLYLDGKRVDGLPGAGDTFSLNDVFRGTHTLVAVVTDQSGKQLVTSQTVTFYMHQASVQAPTRPRPTPH